MFDDLDDVKKPAAEFPRNLENMSIEELRIYITEMEEEIVRVKSDIDQKQASMAAADSVFKS